MSSKISRRTALVSIAMAPTAVGATPDNDARLIELGRQFEEVARKFDDADATAAGPLLDRLGHLEMAIVDMPATTMQGLRVKARAACWALLGDLDPTGEPTTDKRMALSIVRDLIRLYDPKLEQPGALKKLVTNMG
jgi:hypothetical protein